MLSRIGGVFAVLSVGAVLAGSCVAEEAGKSSKNGAGTVVASSRPSIFQNGMSSQKFQTVLANFIEWSSIMYSILAAFCC